jgi:hypothetical protein
MKKTYRGLNPEMLYDEVRDLLSHRGITFTDARMQTYSVQSGATQSRVTVPLFSKDNRECGTIHILGSAGGDVRMTLDLDDQLLAPDAIEALTSDIDFMLGSYEVKW